MDKTVIIFGGGVAGLSAAQELGERGFKVQIYEKREIPGGKARSFTKPGSGTNGRKDLPAEHGFRFFPRFYRHVTDTMKRIPAGGNRLGVYDNLIQLVRMDVPLPDKPSFILSARFPRTLSDLLLTFQDVFVDLYGELGLTEEEVTFFGERLWHIFTSCGERRADELERLSWWDYLGAGSRSEGYQKFLAQGLSKFLVAADAHVTNAKVEGDIVIQLMLGLAEPGVSLDRVLNGPTQDAWIDPWHDYLVDELNVAIDYGTSLKRLHCDDSGRISGATVASEGDVEQLVTGDHYIVALPVEVMAGLLRPDLEHTREGKAKFQNVLKGDPSLAGVVELGKAVGWMNGLQFYLRKDIGIVFGHELYLESNWAMTSISQQQIWPHTPLVDYGDGEVRDVLSVVVSDWNSKGNYIDKPAKDCRREEIREEVWEQMKHSLRADGKPLLSEADRHSWYLDPDISDDPDPTRGVLYKDAEPLFVALNNTWHLRPDAYTRIPNLFLAADYIRTNTQLATMEAANEAARRAVNAILDASGSSEPLCRIWPLHEPTLLGLFRWYDRRRYMRGQPWKEELPGLLRALQQLVAITLRFWRFLRRD